MLSDQTAMAVKAMAIQNTPGTSASQFRTRPSCRGHEPTV